MSGAPDTGPRGEIILDTNVVLDWLVFAHASSDPIRDGILAGRLRWIVSPAMQEELVDVIGRLRHQPSLRRWVDRHDDAMAAVAHWTRPVAAPAPLPLPERLRCTDPDDQCFIDLAMARRTPWLVTRDHALRRLGRRAARFGVAVLTPEAWARQTLDPAARPEAPTPCLT